jgi:hypothetical protein
LRRLISHIRSNAVGYVALFVALGGTAYAASLPANSVGTKQLKHEAVTTKKLKDDTVTTAKVKDGTLLPQDFSAGSLPKGATGATGPTGATGATGGVDTIVLWAVVQAGNGVDPSVLERGRHAVSVNRSGEGIEEVKFDRDVSKCAYGAALGGHDPGVSAAFFLPVSFNLNSKQGAPDTVFVNTAYQSSGVPKPEDVDFHLIVAC